MNLQDTQRLIAFHYWAKNRMLEAVELLPPDQFTREAGGSFGSVRDTIVHILSAECLWLSRWKGAPLPGMLDPGNFPDFASVRRAWAEQERSLRFFFDSLGEDGLQRVITYRSLTGIENQSVLWQMLQHVVNHASYHRGQVTTLLRQLGAPPPKSTDLIAFYRENP
jgi:uncharacterized damage-inducible protein DinB